MSALFPKIETYIRSLSIDQINASRITKLEELAGLIQHQLDQFKAVKLVFVCTHNSRRSQFAQVWTQVLASYFKLEGIQCASAGTESTALYPRVAETLENIGFMMEKESVPQNPRYYIKYSTAVKVFEFYSKTIDEIPTSKNGFVAIMVCTDADENCPYIPEATARFALPYNDPKEYDGSSVAEEEYEKTSRSIATEMYYLLSKISPLND
jgi:arsenate reductase